MIGQTLRGRYTLTARLGKGAMGTVYRAADTQTGQEVALKVLTGELSLEAEMVERFRREGEALRQLRHPNIVGLVDTFPHEGQQVIVMEYVPGGSLHDLIKQGPLSIDRARRIALELCDALTRAHHLNIIHRDIKPENVLIAEDGTPRLTDFGVARLAEGSRLTGTGTQLGTPYYMAPEAWEGNPLDPQADIWSLGVALYEMLAGEVPFGGETLVAVMNKVLTAPLPDLKSKRPEVPDGWVLILSRMLARDRSQRYQSVREVGADLERGQTLAAQMPQTQPEPARPPPRHNHWMLLGMALGGLSVVGGLAMLSAHPQDAPPAYGQLEAVVLMSTIAALALVGLTVWGWRAYAPAKPIVPHNGWALAGTAFGAASFVSGPLLMGPSPEQYLAGPLFLLPALALVVAVLLSVWGWRAERKSSSRHGALEAGLGFGMSGLTIAGLILAGLTNGPRLRASSAAESVMPEPTPAPTRPRATPAPLATEGPASPLDATAAAMIQAKVVYSQDGDIWIANADGTSPQRLTDDPKYEDDPAWSPDGNRIAFDRMRGPNGEDVVVINTDGTGLANLTADKDGGAAPSWSPDGQQLSFNCGSDLCVMRSDGTDLRRLVDFDDYGNYYSAWSPDGSWIAYTHTVPGADAPGPYQWFLLVINVKSTDRLVAHSKAGVSYFGWYQPSWSPAGKQIAFTEPTDGLTYVVEADGSDHPTLVDVSVVETWSQTYWPRPSTPQQ